MILTGPTNDSAAFGEDYEPPLGAIAVIGWSGRFPQGRSVAEFWRNVLAQKNCATRFSDEELKDSFPDHVRNAPNFVKARPILDDVDMFDADFFGMYPREAAVTDPQQRVFLEICWEALEDGGYDPFAYDGPIGVFAGCSLSTYLLHNLCGDRSALEELTSGLQVANYATMTGAMVDSMATRAAYKFNLRGPAITVATACSTSLLAIAQACQSLQFMQADMALAGGVSITFPQQRGYIHQDGGMVSADGTCRPFDADASGTVFGSGAGVVLLKRLEDALEDGDRIYAVIRGAGVNNDGADKVGYTAPSVDGQASAIAAAHAIADVDASSIGYVELHGTATPLGDPIEFEGLKKAFRASTDAKDFCYLGSAKANIGHVDAAAGAAGFIKAALTLQADAIPPMTNFTAPNPRIELDGSPFRINTEPAAWPTAPGELRRAGVSSFGVGGTNVHIVLEEAPPHARRSTDPAPEDDGETHVFPLSARNDAALSAAAGALADRLEADPSLSLADTAYTLVAGRRRFSRRTAIAARTRADAVAKLRASASGAANAAFRAEAPENPPKVIFMFPGQGAQYPGMGRDLYESEPVFRDWIDRGAAVLDPVMGGDIRATIFDNAPTDEDAPHPVRNTLVAQPALFLIQHALAKLWMSWGVQPDAMMGHSVGELVAACISGVIGFEDALRLIAARGRLMSEQEPGAMLSVRAPEARLREIMGPRVDIAGINAPNLCVAAGPFDAIEELEAALAAQDIAHRRLHTSHAFHSAMMDRAVEALGEVAAGFRFGAPTIPYISCVTGDWATAEQAASPQYWARHAREAVRFADALVNATADDKPILIEVGPGRTLATFAGQTLARDATTAVIGSLPDHERAIDDGLFMADALGRVWSAGVEPDWSARRGEKGRRVSLPTYQFQRERHWVEPPPPARGVIAPAAPAALAAAPAQIPPISAPAAPVFEAPAVTIPATPVMDAAAMSQPAVSRRAALADAVKAIIEDLSGEQIAAEDYAASFLELGFDSLFLGQVAQKIEMKLGAPITFRQLLGDYPTIDAVAAYLDDTLAPDAFAAAPAAAPAAAAPAMPMAAPGAMAAMPAGAVSGDLAAMMQAQMATMQQFFAQQMAMLQAGAAGAGAQPVAAPPAAAAIPAAPAVPAPPAAPAAADEGDDGNTRFRGFRPGGAGGAGGAQSDALTDKQKRLIASVVERYTKKYPGSKAFTAKNRPILADPRTAAGFRLEWKEMVYPVVAERAKGSKLWDVDGNEFIDLVNGFLQVMLGHSPDFVLEAITEQMVKGFPIGPQTPLASEVAELMCEFTGHERATFCNTGSEAVMAAMRVARAVTGRETIAIFTNDYHGQFDEVLVKGGRRGGPPKALPIAPGIPRSGVSNMVVLSYGDPDSLEWIRANARELAAVMIEPIQSRHPEHRPAEFVRELRKITQEAGTAYIFDEVVTGFRLGLGGAQEYYGVKADLATYGKVIGSGMPIGVLCGSSRFMDALDGGQWRYGDGSMPEVAPTFFAGTFVRHPLVMAAVRATLLYFKEQGPDLQKNLAARTQGLVGRINDMLASRELALRADTFSSWFTLNIMQAAPLGALFHPLVRLNGVHVLENYAYVMTTAHTDEDLDKVVAAFTNAIDEMIDGEVLTPEGAAPATPAAAGGAGGGGATPAEPALAETAPTEPQSEVWLAAQLSDLASCAFNESASLRFSGAVDHAALTAALNDVIARHDALRARFSRTGERVHYEPELVIDVPVIDLSREADPEAALKARLQDDAQTPFDLVGGPLCRAWRVTLGPDSSVLVFTAHHIVCDGWSLNVVFEDLSKCYEARARGEAPNLPPASSYARYAANEAAKAGSNAEVEAYWLDLYKDVPELPELPTDRPRPPMRSFGGATYTDAIDAELYKAVKKTGGRHGATLFSTLFAGLQALIGRLANHDDVVIACPTAGQTLVEGGESLVGHCVNFLPLRARFDREAPFSAHLKHAQKQLLEAFDRQDFTFGTLVRKLDVKRDINRLPLTEIQFNLERLGDDVPFGGAVAKITPNPKGAANFDMFINVIESVNGLRIDVDYNTDVFDEATIARWIGHYRTLLASFVESPETALADLALMSADEERWLVETLNDTAVEFPRDTGAHQLFAAQAARAPNKTAVVCGADKLTYEGLEKRANQIARHLRAKGVPAGARVAVATTRSIDMLAALLGVMKAGCAYVPIDDAHPDARIAQIFDAADVAAVIANADRGRDIAPAGAIVVSLDQDAREIAALSGDALPDVAPGGERPAYIIFTSGSTGAPKGVEVSHRALTNFLVSMAKKPGMNADDVLVAVTTISFDIAGLELYLPLIVGGQVAIASRDEVREGFGLVDRIKTSRATIVQATPTLWSMLLEAGFKPSDKVKMLCGGEPLPRDLAEGLTANNAPLWNVYGPTETTIWSTAGLVELGDGPIVIGAPIDNTQIHILDPRGVVCPVGVPGELWIGGDGLANGYFGRNDLTSEAFREMSLGGRPAQRLYRTGDLARRLPDGSVQHLGRRDDQVKLRGFRIELGEIEAALRSAPNVAAAAVAIRARAEGAKHLVGYYVPEAGASADPAALSAHVGGLLPDYMTPSLWVKLDALPLTANKKLDRKALPEPAGAASSRIIAPPRNDMEEALASIWREVLKLEEVGVEDNIFSLGADSLHVFRIAARMVDRGIDLEAKDLLKHPTIAALAAQAAANGADEGRANGRGSAPSLRDFRGGARRRGAQQ